MPYIKVYRQKKAGRPLESEREEDALIKVDLLDYLYLREYTWYLNEVAKGYVYPKAKIDGKPVFMHRYILNAPADMEVDHINHDLLDNRRQNLRLVTHGKNMRNRKDNTSGYPGVFFDKVHGMWRVRIDRKHLGYYHTFIQAKARAAGYYLELDKKV